MAKQRVIKVEGYDELDSYSLDRVAKSREADIFVYAYKDDGYDGNGYAIWTDGGKFNYTTLDHCSCNGPIEFLTDKLDYTLDEIEKIINSYPEWQKDDAVATLKTMKEVLGV